MIDIKSLLDEAAVCRNTEVGELQWWAWPEVFGSTAGPRGRVGGQMLTTFQVFGFEAANGRRVKWCSGVWKSWDGRQSW